MPNRTRRSLWSRLLGRKSSQPTPAQRRRTFLEKLEDRSLMATQVFANVPEAANYTLAYELQIPTAAAFRNATPVPYSVNNTASVGSFDRIAYYMELDTGTGSRWVYASMNAFTTNASQIGLPHNVNNPVKFQQIVSNMNVLSNVPGIVTGNGITTGNIEFWPSDFNGNNDIGIPGANSGTFDFGDGGAGTGAGHGSFQIHNHGAGQTLFGFSDWGGNNPGGPVELGIGNNTGSVLTPGGPVASGGSPDWVFANSGGLYTVKNLAVLVRQTKLPTATAPAAPGTLVANAPELAGYQLVYQEALANATNLNSGAVPYDINNSALVPTGSFDRVAYYLELDDNATFNDKFAAASFSTAGFTNNAARIGIPNTTSTEFYQQTVTSLNVTSNVAGVVNGTGITTGNIEFWPSNYGGGAGLGGIGGAGTFDFNDSGANTGAGYGSMQIHNWGAAQTVIAYNAWGTGGNGNLGIGNQSVGEPDWTFNGNAPSYATKNLYVLVRPIEVGTSGNDTITLKRVNGIIQYQITGAAGPVTVSDTAPLVINGLAGNDTVIVDYSGGNPIPTGGLTFNGGDPTTGPGDKLITVGGVFTTATLNHLNSSDGTVVLDGSTITYTGLEPVDITGSTITNLVINLPDTDDATDDITELSIVAGNLIVDSVNGEHEDDLISLTGVTNITVNGRQGDDVITLLASMSAFTGAITIDGGLQVDDINLNGALTLGTNNLLVTGETIDVGAVAIATTGGSQTYNGLLGLAGSSLTTGAGSVILGGNVTVGGAAVSTIAGNLSLGAATRTFTVADAVAGAATDLNVTAIVSNGSLTKAGPGTLSLAGNNTLAGTITATGGVIEGVIGGTVAAPTNPFGTSAIVIDGGLVRYNRTVALDAGIDRKTITTGVNNVTALTNYDAAGTTGVDTQISRPGIAVLEGNRWRGLLQIVIPGNYTFRTNSDDGSVLYIDGVKVVNNEGGHGAQDRDSVAIPLTAGFHSLEMLHSNGGGGGNANLQYTGGAGSDQPAMGIIPTTRFFRSVPIVLPNSVSVTTAGGGIDLAGNIPGLTLGALNVGNAGTTNFAVTAVSGRRLDFSATNLQATGATVNLTVGGGTNLGEAVGLGRVQDFALTGITLDKLGAGRLVLDNNSVAATANDLSDTTLRISDGRIVNLASNVASTTSPLSTAPIVINGGTLTLDTKVGDYTFVNPITVALSDATSGIEILPSGNAISHNTGVTTINAGQTLIYASYGGSAQIRGALLEVNSQITGAGSITKTRVNGNTADNGNGTAADFVRLRNNTNNYTGATLVSGGVLISNVSNGLGATSGDTTVTSGGTLRLENTIAIPAGETISLIGTGFAGLGALRNENQNNSVADQILLTGSASIVSATANTTLTLTNGVSLSTFTATFDGAGISTLPAGTGLVTGTGGVTKAGSGTLNLAHVANTYTGVTSFSGGILNAATIADYGVNSSLGNRAFAAETAAGDGIGLVFRGGTLQYTGATAQSTNRQIRISTAGGAIDASGSNPAATLTFAYGGANINLFDTAGLRTFTLTGSNTGPNTFGTQLTDQAASATSLNKTGAGVWVLNNNTSTYSGSTTVNAGVLRSIQPNALGSVVGDTAVAANATLELNGNFSTAEPILLNGQGVRGAGALISTGTVTTTGRVGLQTNSAIGATAGSTLTLNGPVAKETSSSLTTVGAGDITFNGAISDGYILSSFTARAFNGVQQAINDPVVITNDINGSTVATRTNTLNGPLTFANVGAFNALFTPSLPLGDNFTTVFEATLTIIDAGTYTFAVTNNDDGAATWLKPAANASFVAGDLLQGIVGNNNTAVVARNLTPGSYTLVYAQREGAGGEAVTGRIGGPFFAGYTNGTLLPIANPAIAPVGANSLSVNGTGTVTLTATNTYDGVTTVNNGVLLLSGAAATLGSGTSGTVVENNATLALAGGVTISNEAIQLDGLGSAGQLGALVNNSGNNTIAASSPITARPVSLGEVRLASLAGTLTVDSSINLNSSRLSVDGAGNTLINGDISGTGVTIGTAPAASASNVYGDVAEASRYTLALEHNNVPNAVNGANPFPYTVNNTGSLGAFDRVAYYVELNGSATYAPVREFVFVSMNPFTANLSQIGVPTTPAHIFQQLVANMNVVASASSGVTSGLGLTTGNIEIWNTNYGAPNAFGIPNALTSSTPANVAYDWGDTQTAGGLGYGSFQFHNHDLDGYGTGTAGEVLFAYNNWRSGTGDLGIGSNATAVANNDGIDYTFADNLTSYTFKRMSILVREVNPSYRQTDNSLVKLGGGTLTLAGTNTYNGTTSVNAGVLQVQNGAAIDDAAGAVSVANLATFQLLSNETISSFVGSDNGANENDSILALGGNTLTTIGSATIANVTSANGSLIAGTDIIDGDTDNNVTGTGVFLSATGSVGALANPIETSVANLEGSSGTGFFVASATDVTIGGVTAAAGISSTGDVVVSSLSLLTVSENISGTGAGTDITLTTIDAAGAGQNLAINATATISTAAGLITVNAGDNATILGTLVSGNTITVNIDAGVADPGVGGSLVFDGDVDAPLAVFNGSADTNGDSFDVRPDQDVGDVLTPIQVFGFAPFAGAYPVGDRLIVDIAGLGTPTLTIGPGARNGSFSFGALAASLTYNDIETVESDPPGATFHVVLDMRYSGFENGADDTILAQLNAAGDMLQLFVNAASVFEGADADIESLTIIGSNDDEALTVQETAGGLPNFGGAAPVQSTTPASVAAPASVRTSAVQLISRWKPCSPRIRPGMLLM
jgi:fibronectin-binding autotransporter adhesin